MATKVVIENAVSRGSQQEQFWQTVATVFGLKTGTLLDVLREEGLKFEIRR
jgi:hypothetical protein